MTAAATSAVVPVAFELGGFQHKPGDDALIVFVKEDCPTCREVMPLLATWANAGQCQLVGQTAAGNDKLRAEFNLGDALVDDASLAVSFAWNIETVPTLIRDGANVQVLEGFVRDEWQSLAQGDELAPFDFGSLPAWRPGCGSLSVDPAHADRLRAEAEGSPLRARKVEIGSADDEFEFLFDAGFSDGLPLVPPTPERVLRMLDGCRRDPQSIVATVPPNLAEVTVEKVAINAVMAGCKPEYLPVVLAAVEAVCTDEFNAHGVMATTMGAAPVLVVNGPIRHQIDMNMELGALGQGNRANATIGRAVRLVLRNVGGAVPGGTERSTLGSPLKYTMCFAEWEERSPWDPLHVERGFDPNQSVVTAFGMSSGPTYMVDQDSRTASQLAGSFGLCLKTAFHPRAHSATDVLVVVCPEHVDTLQRDGYSKSDIRKRILEVTNVRLADLIEDDISGVGLKQAKADAMPPEVLERIIPKFAEPEHIALVVAGSDAGKFSGAFHGWVRGPMGTVPVSRPIDPI